MNKQIEINLLHTDEKKNCYTNNITKKQQHKNKENKHTHKKKFSPQSDKNINENKQTNKNDFINP